MAIEVDGGFPVDGAEMEEGSLFGWRFECGVVPEALFGE